MSEINKLLWFLLTLSINGLISIIITMARKTAANLNTNHLNLRI